MRMSSDEYAAFVNSLSPRSPIWGDLLRAGLVGGAIDSKADESDIIGLSQKAFKHLDASMMI